MAGPSASELTAVLHTEVQLEPDRRKEAVRRVIHGRKDPGQDRGPAMEAMAKPSWEKEKLSQTVTPRDGAQQGMVQVTPVLALPYSLHASFSVLLASQQGTQSLH